jgi:hypothetical protein
MSTVHLTEVLGRLARDGRALDQVLDQLERMGIAWIDFDRALAVGAAALLRPTAPLGLSFCHQVWKVVARRDPGRAGQPAGHLHLPDFWRGLSLGDGGETGERGLVGAAVAQWPAWFEGCGLRVR